MWKFYPRRSSSGQAVVTGVVPSPPRYVPLFLSCIGLSIPTARRFPSNIYFPGPWSEVKYFRVKILQVLRVLEVSGLYELRHTASTRSISMFCTGTAVLTIFRGSTLLWNTAVLLYFQVFEDSVLRVLPGAGNTSSVDTASTASTKKLSICAVYSQFGV